MGRSTHFFFSQMEITDKIKELAHNLCKEKEIELVDISYKKAGPQRILKLIVDKKGGVTADECGWVNENLGTMLDQSDLLVESYTLEVSSPGLDRHLKTKKDFDQVIGELIRVHTYGPIEDKREHVGKVISCDGESVAIELIETSAQRSIPLDKISKARLEITF